MSDKFDLIEAAKQRTLAILANYERLFEEFEKSTLPVLGKTSQSVLIPAKYLENAYTALETLFMKISQYFENHLEEKRWHQDLLEKMLLDIPGIRPRVLQEETYRLLLELLRFRHFNRYYFELDYDWRKIDLLVTQFRESLPLVRRDLESFLSLVRAALEEDSRHRPTPGL